VTLVSHNELTGAYGCGMGESVCIFMTFTVFYCTFYLFCLSVCLSVCMSLCVCVWAMLPDSNKMMMMMMWALGGIYPVVLQGCTNNRVTKNNAVS